MSNLFRFIFLCLFGLTHALSAAPFVSAKLHCQLGNQMFQIAAATSLALDNGAIAVFPDLKTKKTFNIPKNYKKVFFRLETKRPGPVEKVYVDLKTRYKPIPYRANMRIEGWFQSEKYFKHHKKEILELFAPSEKIKSRITKKYGKILSHPCTVAVHYRSYYKEDLAQTLHPTQTKEYYLKAITYYPEDALFIVCSDKISWCKEHFADIPRKFIFIEGDPYYQDLYLMSMCKHNIISNSSFSWWSAYLNPNPEKIVTAPKQWFTKISNKDFSDIVPEEWITID